MYFISDTGAKACPSVGLSDCLSLCLSVPSTSKNHMSELHQIFDACCLWPWFGPSVMALWYVVHILPVLRMTLRFQIMARHRRREAWIRYSHEFSVYSVGRQSASPGRSMIPTVALYCVYSPTTPTCITPSRRDRSSSSSKIRRNSIDRRPALIQAWLLCMSPLADIHV